MLHDFYNVMFWFNQFLNGITVLGMLIFVNDQKCQQNYLMIQSNPTINLI